VGVAIRGFALELALHRAQVEEQLALRLGGRHLDHAPVLQDVLVDLGLDPVQRVADQAHALLGVEPLDGLHEPDVAFLDQVAVRQAVTQVLPRHRHDQPQVGQHQPAGCVQILLVTQLARQTRFLFSREHGQPIHCRDIGIQIAQRWHQGPRVTQGDSSGGRQLHGGHRLCLRPEVPISLALDLREC
jgi:hypothetical protein